MKHLEENEAINSLDIQTEIDNTKTELETELKYIVNGSKLRSKIRRYEEGEKPTKYFFNLEKRDYNNKVGTK